MEITRDTNGTVFFKGAMVISEIENIHVQLEALLDETTDDIRLDLSEVDEIDTSGLQLLYALWRDVGRSGALQLKSISPQVRETLTISGFDRVFREVVQ